MSRPGMVMGIETEYGIYVRGNHGSRYSTAVQEANEVMRRKMYGSPIAMGRQLDITLGSRRAAYQHVANGSRFYIDVGHPELSTPECLNPRDVVLWDAAGERLVHAAAQEAATELGYGVSIVKKLVDGLGQTWGCHENYCIDPTLFYRITKEPDLVAEQRTLATWLVVRQLLIGAGKVGTDDADRACAFQISQRADFIVDFRNENTMHNRPIIQIRDEALGEQEGWRRLHIICGDANLCQWSTYLKMALTALLLMVWQDRGLKRLPPLPVLVDEQYYRFMHFMSRDSDLVARYPVRMAPGRSQLGGLRHMTAAEILSLYVDALASYAQNRSWSSPEEASIYRTAAAKAQWMAGLLRKREWRSLYGWLDWPTKRIAVEEYLRRKDKNWSDLLNDFDLMYRMKILGNHNYAALDPGVSLYARLLKAGVIKTIARPSEIGRAVGIPPVGRAAQRALLVETFGPFVQTAHWDKVCFKQPPYTIVVDLEDPFGCPDEEFRHALSLCPTPLDLFAYQDRHQIPSLSMSVQRELPHA